MPTPKIYFLPGLAGSSLVSSGLDPWPASNNGVALSTFFQSVLKLKCDSSGHPTTTYTVGPPQESYANIIQQLGATACTYDWTQNPTYGAGQVIGRIQQPGWIVAHSYGTVIATAVLQALKANGDIGLVKGIIFIAGPIVGGNWGGAVTSLQGGTPGTQDLTNSFFDLILHLGSGGHYLNLPSLIWNSITGQYISPKQQLLSVISTWPCMTTLLPGDTINAATRSLNFWVGVNPYITAPYLLAGMLARQQLPTSFADPVFAGLPTWNIYGSGFNTRSAQNDSTLSGDGTVTIFERLPGATGEIFLADRHTPILDDPLCYGAIHNIVQVGNPDGTDSGQTELIEKPAGGPLAPGIFPDIPVWTPFTPLPSVPILNPIPPPFNILDP